MKKREKRASISKGRKVGGRGLTDEAEYGKLQHRIQRERALGGRRLTACQKMGKLCIWSQQLEWGANLRKEI